MKALKCACSDLVEGLSEVVQDVVDMLRTDGQPDGGWRDVLLGQFLRAHLRVGGGIGVDDEALHVGHIRQQREDLQRIDEAPSLFLSAFDLEGENAAAAIGEVAVVEGMVGVVGQARMVDLGHLRVILEEIDYLQRILYVALNTQAERLYTLQEEK